MCLTPKQEAFVQAIADGLSQADAYRKAFNVSSTTKPETIHKRASELIGKGEVAGRLAELKQALSAKALWTREKSVRGLAKAYEIAEESRNPTAMTGAIKELNAMHGFNAPTELHVTSKELPASVDEFV